VAADFGPRSNYTNDDACIAILYCLSFLFLAWKTFVVLGKQHLSGFTNSQIISYKTQTELSSNLILATIKTWQLI
jgi:hypothetical protein